jgi:hypothetical protein
LRSLNAKLVRRWKECFKARYRVIRLASGCARSTERAAGAWAVGGTRTRLPAGPRWTRPNNLIAGAKLPRRLATLSVQAHLLPWVVDHITKWVGTTLAAERGTWVTGVPGAVAEFPCGPEHNVEVVLDRDFVGGRTGKAVFRLNLHDKLRAFAFGQRGARRPWHSQSARAACRCTQIDRARSRYRRGRHLRQIRSTFGFRSRTTKQPLLRSHRRSGHCEIIAAQHGRTFWLR